MYANGMTYSQNVKQPYTKSYSGSLIIEPNVALFLSRWASASDGLAFDFRTEIQVQDLGDLSGASNV